MRARGHRVDREGQALGINHNHRLDGTNAAMPSTPPRAFEKIPSMMALVQPNPPGSSIKHPASRTMRSKTPPALQTARWIGDAFTNQSR